VYCLLFLDVLSCLFKITRDNASYDHKIEIMAYLLFTEQSALMCYPHRGHTNARSCDSQRR